MLGDASGGKAQELDSRWIKLPRGLEHESERLDSKINISNFKKGYY
jgi:hypothetical protein